MESQEIFRRIFHMTAVVYLVYYILPEELLPGFYKWYGVLIVILFALSVEGVRLKTGKIFFGLRKYEKRQISAFAWFAIGMGCALLLFKMEYVVPVVIGMAFTDPLIGEIKRRREKLYPTLPLIFYGAIVFLCLFFLTEVAIILLILFTFLATISAIFAEWWKVKYIDDDFLMLVIPLVVLSALDYFFTLLDLI
ncbi:MAG: hypothetical protein JSV09_03555 [Thermoplasmata archaeon]|nr:MAG: hypothetical protein JSV09_03555 [Thermoplasmata archaeon]